MIISDIQTARRCFVAQKVDDIFIVDFEVADSNFSYHMLMFYPVKDLSDGQGNEPCITLYSFHSVSLSWRSLSIGKDAC